MATPQVTVINPSPKTRFLQSQQNISKHREMIDSDAYQRAEDFGLREYCARLSQTTEDQLSGAMGLKIKGAHEVLMTIRMLSEPPKPLAPAPSDNLDTKVQ